MTELEVVTPNLRGSCVAVQHQIHGLFKISKRAGSPADVAPLYTWSIIDAQNRVKLTRQVSDSQAQNLMFPITIPAGSLEPGKYALRVLSKQEARYEFTVR